MKRVIVFLLVLVVAGISSAVPVVFNDPNLKAAVEAKLGIIDPDATEMLLLTSLDANSLGISDLTGLEYATNLTTLYLCNNIFGDLSPLSGLTKMKYLYLWGNPYITSLASLANMSDLRYLKASGCNITYINVVSNFKKLEGLSLGDNLISNITPLADINSLKYLYLSLNNISDINVFKDPDVNNLRELDLSDNFISDINALSGLTKLTYLNLRYNELGNINPLSGLKKLVYLYLSYNDNIPDINAVKDMNSLVELSLTDVNLSNIFPLADVNQIQILWLGSNQIEDINALTKYHNLTLLKLSYNPLSFQSWCVYLRQIRDNNPTATIRTVPAANGLMNVDSTTDFNDLRIFATQWLRSGCNTNNAYCNCADSTESGMVNFEDYVDFADWWMYQP